jgi:hypothetical protein
MLDTTAAQLALRNHALTVTVATTGTTSLAATATGYTRAAGSFVADGFKVGMEVLAAGFATAGNNGYKVVTAVTAGTLTVTSATTMATEAAGGNESIVCGFPEGRAWENTDFTPTSGRVYVEEDFIPATTEHFAGSYTNGVTRETGLYVLKWYGLSGSGIGAIRACTDALKDLFTPGTALTAGSHAVKVRGDVGPWVGELLPLEGGRTVATLTVSWWATTSTA